MIFDSNTSITAEILKDLRLGHIEERLGLPTGFFVGLDVGGTDWEFTIKLVVILEAALAAVIVAHLHNEAVTSHVEKLNLNGGRTGKLALAESLQILSPVECKAFAALADIRNGFAHKVANIALDLPSYGARLGLPEVERTTKRLLMIAAEEEKGTEHLWQGLHSIKYFRLSMFCSGAWILDALARQDQRAAVEADRRKWFDQSGGKRTKLAALGNLASAS